MRHREPKQKSRKRFFYTCLRCSCLKTTNRMVNRQSKAHDDWKNSNVVVSTAKTVLSPRRVSANMRTVSACHAESVDRQAGKTAHARRTLWNSTAKTLQFTNGVNEAVLCD